jgi:putative DNA primase/helicase
VRPRANLLGVQVRRVTFIEGALDEEGRKRQFQLSDVPKLEAVLERNKGIRLLIVDPVMSLIGGSVDAACDNEVRAALAPLVELAARYRVAVLGIMHLRKGEASKALYRISSSAAFGGMARSVLLVSEEADTKRKAIAQIKTNLGAPSEPIEFRIDHLGLTWMGIAPDLSDTALLAASTGETLGGKDEAEEFLRQMLADGPREAKSIQREARREGISERTLTRAKATLGVRSRRDHGCWWWEMLGSHPLLPLDGEVGHVGHVTETPVNTPSNQHGQIMR